MISASELRTKVRDFEKEENEKIDDAYLEGYVEPHLLNCVGKGYYSTSMEFVFNYISTVTIFCNKLREFGYKVKSHLSDAPRNIWTITVNWSSEDNYD